MVSKCDAAWVGHKRCDTDKVLGGDAGTRVEGRMMPEQHESFFPLRDWTHEDVWQYIEENDVPYDKARYMKVDGEWSERPRQGITLTMCACTACLDRESGRNLFIVQSLDLRLNPMLKRCPG